MMKKLMGLTAALTLSLLATAAWARPAALDRAEQVARPAPAAHEHFRHDSARTAPQREHHADSVARHARPARIDRLQVRGDLAVGSTARSGSSSVSHAALAGRPTMPSMRRVNEKVSSRARCEDSMACGSRGSDTTSSRTTASHNPNTQRDGVSVMREQLYVERIRKMIMAKLMAKMHPGKE